MGLFHWFEPKELPKIQIKDTEGSVILERPWSSLENKDLRGLSFVNAELSHMKLDYADCRGTIFTGSKCMGTSFRNCNLQNARMDFCDLTQARLNHANLAGCDFSATEFSRGWKRTCMDDVVGLREALMSPYELIHAGRFNSGKGKDKHHRLSKLQTMPKSQCDQVLARPRCLLLLGDPIGPFQKYESAKLRKQQTYRRRPRISGSGHNQAADQVVNSFAREEQLET